MRTLGLDIGTGSSKGVVVDERGTLLASAVRPHPTSTPHPGQFEHDAEAVWWADARTLIAELLAAVRGGVDAVAASGIGPAVVVTDEADQPLRPGILYGIDTRSELQIERQTRELGDAALLGATGNLLTTQAVGPKLAWIAENEPDVWRVTRRVHSAPGWVVHHLTGAYTLDHYSASASVPLYELARQDWWAPGWAGLEQVERPTLAWPGDVVGRVTQTAAAQTGLAAGTPVLAGTIDALAEAYSAGVRDDGDMMLMFGSTMFFVQLVGHPVVDRGLWAATGRTPGSFACAAGMSTSGLLVRWLSELVGTGPDALTDAAREVPAGSDGLLLLPYFAGERTPLFDPAARGAWVGLTLRHGPGHLFRSVLEAVALGIRHNIGTMTAAGAPPRRLVAVGGGARNDLWLQIVADVTGVPVDVPGITVGASYGDARMAAEAIGVDTSAWNPIVRHVAPDPSVRTTYDQLFEHYRGAYPALRDTMHALGTLG
jgi:xylulokinase